MQDEIYTDECVEMLSEIDELEGCKGNYMKNYIKTFPFPSIYIYKDSTNNNSASKLSTN